MQKLKAILVGIILLVSAMAQAQTDYLEKGATNSKIFMMGLYPPDVIMQHQQRLGISDNQRTSISKAVKQFQSEVAELQWTMQNQQQLLLQSLSVNDIDSESSLERAGQVLAMESQFKLAHLKLLIAIKNELTDEQIQMIQQRLQQKRQGRAQ